MIEPLAGVEDSQEIRAEWEEHYETEGIQSFLSG